MPAMFPLLLALQFGVPAAPVPPAMAVAVPAPPVAPHQLTLISSAAVRPLTAAAAWEPATDPADSLLRAASEKLSRGDYRGAAALYRSAVQRFPGSMRLSEAMYYEAFALYRAGELPRAREALDVLREKYPRAAARGDADALRTRICGELARTGDRACAEEVTRLSALSVDTAASAPLSPLRRRRSDRPGAVTPCPEENDDDDTRIAALNALLQMDAERAMPILTSVLARRDRCSDALRRKAVFLVSQKPTRESANILLNAAQNDPDAEVRQQAVFWLSQVRDPRAADMLVEIIRSDADPALRERALFSLAQSTSAKATETLRSFAESEQQPTDLREKAIFWLGQRRGAEHSEYLRGLYRSLRNADLREKVLFSLSQRRDAGTEGFLLGIVSDGREPMELRKKAIFWAGQGGVGITQLTGLYATLENRDMKEQLIFALSQRREPAAVEKLMDIARNDGDRGLRSKAVFWLGQSRDPRATAFLAELIGK
jgi:HEAT repeat protein